MNKYIKSYQLVDGLNKNVRENTKSREKWDYYTQTREVSKVPSHIDIEPTNACNVSCIMCERKNMKRKVGFMAMELYEKIISQCTQYGISSIKLNLWGESLLHGNMIEMIKMAKAAGIERVQFNTNGVLLNESMAEGLCRSGLDYLTVSVDGASEKTYTLVRKGSSYQVVIGNIENLIAFKNQNNMKKPYITLQIIRMTETEEEIESFVSRWKDRAQYVTVTNIATVSGMNENLQRSPGRRENLMERPCPQLWQRLSIHWNGDITICCSDFDGFLSIGNIKDSSIMEIWNSEKLNELRSRHMGKDFKGLICQTCDGRFD